MFSLVDKAWWILQKVAIWVRLGTTRGLVRRSSHMRGRSVSFVELSAAKICRRVRIHVVMLLSMPAGTSAAKDTSSLLLLQLYHFHAQAVGPVPEAKEHLVVQGRRLSERPDCGGFGMWLGAQLRNVLRVIRGSIKMLASLGTFCNVAGVVFEGPKIGSRF